MTGRTAGRADERTMIELLRSHGREAVDGDVPTAPGQYAYFTYIDTVVGDALTREDLKWASRSGILTETTGKVLPILYPLFTGVGYDVVRFVPGVQSISLPLPSNRVIAVDSKRFVKVVSFERGEMINVLKDGRDGTLLEKEIRLRESAETYVTVPRVYRYSLDDAAFFVEELVEGRQLPPITDTDDTAPLDILFEQLFTWYESQDLETVDSKEYLDELVTTITGSPLYDDCRDAIDIVIGRVDDAESGRLLCAQTHGDFHRRNIIERNSDLVVVDWEMAGSYVLVHDLCNFCFHSAVFDDDETLLQEYLPEGTVSRLVDQRDVTLDMAWTYILAYMLEKLSRFSTVYSDRDRAIERIERWSSSFERFFENGDTL